MSSNPEFPSTLHDTYPWNPENQAIWFASSLILRRNSTRHNFPSKLQKSEAEQILETIKGGLTGLSELENPQYYLEKELSANQRNLLFEHFLLMRPFSESSAGPGIVLENSGKFLGLINGDNHFEIRSLISKESLEETWNSLANIENTMGKTLDFAFSPKFGYLTADPTQCGTGLTIHAFLHLPALIHANQIESALSNSAEDNEILFMGVAGNLEDLIGDLIVLQNNYTLGVSEEAILHSIQTTATKLVGAEKTMRAHLKEEQNTEIKDLISKAYGLIAHSYQLDAKEALDLLSLMKLGLSLNYISGVEDATLSNLFFKCRQGHLAYLFSEVKETSEIAHKRAELLKQELQGIQLSPELK